MSIVGLRSLMPAKELLTSQRGEDGLWHAHYGTASRTLCNQPVQPVARGRKWPPTCEVCMGELAGLLGITANWLTLTIGAASVQVHRLPAERVGEHGMHDLWYRWLTRAGIVAPGTTSGNKLHAARHTAAQRMLEKTGNMRAVQALLCHTSLNTTEHYVGWEIEQLAGSLREAAPADDLSLSLHDRVRQEGVRV